MLSGGEAVDDSSWFGDAACRGTDVEIFYSDDPGATSQALQLCRSCPVREPCLRTAMQEREFDGVWGGVPEAHRRRTFRRRDRERRRGERAA
jgi:WhiB family transcriptional regulator, redox-sensing transcriptional regulator